MDDKKETAILYVDDEEPNLILFKALFEKNYEVFTASSGQEALVRLHLSSDRIKAVISDMSMPEMNGVEFIKKARHHHKSIGYFILTGYGNSEEINEALKENIIHKFFTKPFKPEEIQQAIEEFV
ncbi:MAG: response regulator [Bacteroidota bacterium]